MKTITLRVLILVGVQATADAIMRTRGRIRGPHKLTQTEGSLHRVLGKIKEGPKMKKGQNPSRMGVKTKKVATKISNLT